MTRNALPRDFFAHLIYLMLADPGSPHSSTSASVTGERDKSYLWSSKHSTEWQPRTQRRRDPSVASSHRSRAPSPPPISDAERKTAARIMAERSPPDAVESEGAAILKQIATRLPASTAVNSPVDNVTHPHPVRNPFHGGSQHSSAATAYQPASMPKRSPSIRSMSSQCSTSPSVYESAVSLPRRSYDGDMASRISSSSLRTVVPSGARVKEQVLDYLMDLFSSNYARQSSTILQLCSPHVIYQNPMLFVTGTQDLIDIAKVLPGICRNVSFIPRSSTVWTAKQTATPHTILVEATITITFKPLLVWRLMQYAFGDTYTYRSTHIISADAYGKIVHHEEVVSLKDFLAAVPILGRLYQLGRPCLAMLVGGRVGGLLLRCLDGDPRRQDSGAKKAKPAPQIQLSAQPYFIPMTADPVSYIDAIPTRTNSPTPSNDTFPIEERELVPLRTATSSPPPVEVVSRRGWLW
ncbi:hypothetical protein DFJ77DRAFT_454170 [Powellomyces hirtus]|nr:hypothetical protein DFJ77DRAFT_454170 [Powellomyces hirtus]